MTLAINTIVFLASFFAMEFVAWFAHKYVMHGFLWSLHRDHHERDTTRFWERNDFFFVIFALPGILLMFFGVQEGFGDLRFWIGTGIAVYGFTYFFVHDIFIHQRFKWLRKSDNIYLMALRKAHKIHHKHLQKEDGECFGMLVVPKKYWVEARKARNIRKK